MGRLYLLKKGKTEKLSGEYNGKTRREDIRVSRLPSR